MANTVVVRAQRDGARNAVIRRSSRRRENAIIRTPFGTVYRMYEAPQGVSKEVRGVGRLCMPLGAGVADVYEDLRYLRLGVRAPPPGGRRTAGSDGSRGAVRAILV